MFWGRCLALVFAGLAAGACGEAVLSSSRAPAPSGACAAPMGARRVVLVLTRFVVPHVEPSSREVAEITVEGACSKDVECVHVPAATLERLAQRVAALGVLRRAPPVSSPHYGARYLELRWDGGACSVGDSPDQPLEGKDARRFGDAFAAAVDVVLSRRPAP